MYGRHSTEVVGYTYFADLYCADCAESFPEVDPEGNPRHAIFLDGLDGLDGHNCGECGSPTSEW
jgi:hypothetical protein